MSWIEQGQGIPVVLVHGIPTSPDRWRKVLPLLPGVRALAWEMVGYGQSIAEGRTRDISVGQQANYLASWMRHLGIGKAIMVGHDLGGGVVQIAAVRQPGLCGGLLLTNAIGYDSWPIPSVSALKYSAPVTWHLPRPLFKLLLANLLYRGHDTAEAAREAFRTHAPNYLSEGGAAALIAQIEHLQTSDTLAVADALPRLDIPARIVWGRRGSVPEDTFRRTLRAGFKRTTAPHTGSQAFYARRPSGDHCRGDYGARRGYGSWRKQLTPGLIPHATNLIPDRVYVSFSPV